MPRSEGKWLTHFTSQALLGWRSRCKHSLFSIVTPAYDCTQIQLLRHVLVSQALGRCTHNPDADVLSLATRGATFGDGSVYITYRNVRIIFCRVLSPTGSPKPSY